MSRAVYRYHGRFVSKSYAQKLGALPSTRTHIRSENWEGNKRIVGVAGYVKPIRMEVHAALEKDRQAKAKEREQARLTRQRIRDAEREAVERMKRPPEEGPPAAGRPAYEGAKAWTDAISLQPVAYEDRLYDAFFDDFIEVADVDDEDLYGG